MKLHTFAFSFLAASLLVPASAIGQESPDLPEDLRSAYGAFAKAMVEGQAEQAADFYAEDAVVLVDHKRVYRGRPAIREGFLANYLDSSAGEKGTDGGKTNIEVDGVAAGEGVVTLAGRFSSPMGTSGVYSNTWQREGDGSWKLAISVMTFESLERSPSHSQENRWTAVLPGGETACAGDSEYRFFVRHADPERLLVYFAGGGACWNAKTCNPETDGFRSIPPVDHPAQADRSLARGIFNLENPQNPFLDYSMVVVPYCTRDVHLGDRKASYTLEKDDGEQHAFIVAHRGQANVAAVRDWIHKHIKAPEQIFVAGLSAGAVGLPFHADRLARQFPDTRVIGLGVGAAAYKHTAMPGVEEERWGLAEVLRRHDGWEDFGPIGTNTLYRTAAGSAPNLELYQIDFAHDDRQRHWMRAAGTPQADVLEFIRGNRRAIERESQRFRWFTLGGYEHSLLGFPKFYVYRTGDYSVRDWVADIASEKSVPSVGCKLCERPDLSYTAGDVHLIERALELLSSEDRWNARKEESACPDEAEQWSLRCALFEAARQIGEAPVGSYAVAYDVLYTAFERLAGNGPFRSSLRRYNNLESTGLEDVRSLLSEVRERAESNLSEG